MERMQTGSVVADFELLSGYVSGQTEENYENLRIDGLCVEI
jgi:hypothetical protein